MKNPIIISLFSLSLFIMNCGSSNHTESKAVAADAPTHEEEVLTVATLTQEQIKAVGISLGKIESKELTATIRANGMLKVPNNSKGNATSLYGGVIKTLEVQIGDYVKKGQVIATITNPQFLQLQEEYLNLLSISNSTYTATTANNSQYASAKLQYQEIENQISYAEKELDRQKELYEGNAGAKKNVEQAQTNLEVLQAKKKILNEQMGIYEQQGKVLNTTRLASLKQQLQLMGIDPNSVSNSNLKSTLVVTSPLNGNVSNLFAKIGSYVDVSSPVAEVVDNGSLHLDLQVFEKDLPLLKIGQIIHFTLTNNPTNEYDAKVFSIGSAFENESKTISVHCDVTGNKAGLIDGMNITGIVSLNNATTPAVPSKAIVNVDGKDYLFIVTDKKPPVRKEEESGEHGHSHAEGEEHSHSHDENEQTHKEEPKDNVNFERVEVIKGVTDLGYTSVIFVKDIPTNAQIVVEGAFFINAKLSNTGGHHH